MLDPANRRRFLSQTGLVIATWAAFPASALGQQKNEAEEEVSPVEDLMREHGLLNRVLLIYEACGRRLAEKRFDPAVLNQAAGIIKQFIEDYHEKLEEDYLFPRFEKAGKLVDLVSVLRTQHAAGRKVTARLLQASTGKARGRGRQILADIHQFIRMYRPHEAREDTVLFPALHSIISKNEYDSLGEDFEKKEHELFGKAGFEGMVDKVAELEKKLGIDDLARFTPA